MTTHSLAGQALAGGLGALVKASVGVPVVGHVTGWAVQHSVNTLITRVHDAVSWANDLAEVETQLQDTELQIFLTQLDEVTDMPGSPLRERFVDVCELLMEANFVVARGQAAQDAGGVHKILEVVVRSVKGDMKKLKDMLSKLQHDDSFICLSRIRQEVIKHAESYSERAAGLTRDCNVPQPIPREGRGPIANSASAVERRVERLVQHGADFVPHLCSLLATTTNVGIVGMGGIGKTRVARAVYARAKASSDFAHTVWLEVKQTHNTTELLQQAFVQLFGRAVSSPIVNSTDGLERIAQLLYERKQPVLLVLDDVWCSSQQSAVAALNFATNPTLMVPGSRLIVTTRQRSSLSFAPYKHPVTPMQDLEVVEVPLLSRHHQLQLFRQEGLRLGAKWTDECYMSSSEERSRVIAECGGNPKAIISFAQSLRHEPAADWAQRSKEFETKMEKGEDPTSLLCAKSIEDLPPSVMDCFVAFAAFPVDAWVPQADLLHLFAMHSPVHTTESISSAEYKLDDLEQRSLVRKSVQAGRPEFSMHRILYRAAHRMASGKGQPQPSNPSQRLKSAFCFHFEATNGDAHYLSLHRCPAQHYSIVLQKYTQNGSSNKLRACIMSEVKQRPSPLVWPSRIRHLHLRKTCPKPLIVDDDSDRHLDRHQQGPPALQSLILARTDPQEKALKLLLPAGQLLHLDLSECSSLKQLPDCIVQCKQLIRLNLSGCPRLEAFEVDVFPSLLDLDLSECKNLQNVSASETWLGCTALTHLNLSGCSSLSELPSRLLKKCKALARLNLSWCSNLSGLPIIAADIQVQHIDLSECVQLSSLPESFENCSVLKHLNLSGCSSLSEVPDSINLCGELASLVLTRCAGARLSFPDTLDSCSMLEHVCLKECSGLIDVPQCITSLRSLTCLDLSGCRDLQQLPEHNPGVESSLMSLHLVGCEGFKSFPWHSHGYSHLTYLEAKGCSSHRFSLPHWIGDCTSLAHVDLQGCSSLSCLPQTITQCSQLSFLCLRQCATQLDPAAFHRLVSPAFELTGIAHLDISGCKNLQQLPSLSRLHKLAHLNLSGCTEMTEVPASIYHCSQLAVLCLQGCSSLEQVPERICDCVHLAHLDLRGCSKLHNLPFGMKDLKQLQYLAVDAGSDVMTWLMMLPDREHQAFERLIDLALTWPRVGEWYALLAGHSPSKILSFCDCRTSCLFPRCSLGKIRNFCQHETRMIQGSVTAMVCADVEQQQGSVGRQIHEPGPVVESGHVKVRSPSDLAWTCISQPC